MDTGLFNSGQVLNATLDDGLHKVNRACESGQKLLPRVTDQGREKIEGEMEKIKEEWDEVNKDLNASNTRLESQLNLWDVYNDKKDMLSSWLNDVEAELSQGAEPKVELMEKKAQLEKFKVNF